MESLRMNPSPMAVTRLATRNGAKQHNAANAAPPMPTARRIRPSHDGWRAFAPGCMASLLVHTERESGTAIGVPSRRYFLADLAARILLISGLRPSANQLSVSA